jgi:hypothetical protein
MMASRGDPPAGFFGFVGLAGILASKRNGWEGIGFWEFQINVGRTKQSLSTETDP